MRIALPRDGCPAGLGGVPRRIRFNAFDMNCVAHQSPGLWRHPDDHSPDYRNLRYWTDLAQLLERGVFDGIFIADVLGTYDVYGADATAALRQGAQVPVNDPMMLVSAMATVTEHLGFGVTAATGFEHPYPFARRASTLDHLTDGRFGWNVVTGYLPAAARAMGEADQMPHDRRYDHADEYLEVLYKLWEGSWDDDAVVRDPERGVFTDPDKVHEIDHHGEFFEVTGIHLSEPSPQRTPVIYQAGASPRGQRFAAENAEAVFTGAPTKEVLAQTVADIRKALTEAGRDPYSARIYTMLTVITDETSEGARAKHERLASYSSDEGALSACSSCRPAGWASTCPATTSTTPSATSSPTPSSPRSRRSSRPTRAARSGRSGTSRAGAGSAGWDRGSSARRPRWPTSCSRGSTRPTSTGSTCPTRSPRARSPTSSSTWCPNCSGAGCTRSRTSPGRCARSSSGAGTGCPTSTGARRSAGRWPSAS
jgi:FMN-dependent oxidoreductase (nitrilotriacetate monooxygenase family)